MCMSDADIGTADRIDWASVADSLFDRGVASISQLLSADSCTAVRSLFNEDARFRKTIVMERIGYGRGTYKYFDYPLPDEISELRTTLYAGLAPIANRMNEVSHRPDRFPASLDAWTNRCHGAGQTRATPLLLRYGPGGYNALHRDLYGDLWFPLQVVVQLSDPDHDFDGGEFLLVEQRPRQQSIGRALRPALGEALVFPVFDRPVARQSGRNGSHRGWTRRPVRHGVSEVTSGERTTLGIIFHDAA